MAVSSSTVLRVRGLPSNSNTTEVTTLIERSLEIGPEASGLKITSLAEDPYQAKKQVATLVFLARVPPLFATSTAKEWSINASVANCSPESDGDLALTFDTHFRGLTALNTPRVKEAVVDCVAVCGLGGHAFGSFKERGTSYMWLRDSLPKDLPNLRVLLYGYESGLEERDSSQNVSVIADSFVGHLSVLRPPPKLISTPLIIVAHSLGGLVVKQVNLYGISDDYENLPVTYIQAIMKLGRGNASDKKQMESVVGLLFFGVPNRGMDIDSLQAIVGDKQNRYLLESVGQYSDLLLQQDGQFGSTFHYKDTHIISFFETKSSPTAMKVNGSWRMTGPRKVLVSQFSATRPRLWESEGYDESLNRTHSDLVKFSSNDVDYERVHHRLREITSEVTATLTSRYLSQESPNSFNAEEEACLRSLSFADIYARESTIDQAVQDTGKWLLESQNFNDWIQRARLHEHRGFFWVQGNPGSGKSTLMKKVYSYIRTRSQDPSSVIAAFFFNARGNKIEKSPTGLFRTLLHNLCQNISALRETVVNTYVAKRKILSPDWQWQLSELKELLTVAVTPSVLGKRSLILCIDALDECDSTATQSVIRVFEDMARVSLSEGTNFNICLSSRYWPQIRIQHCFVARVELENQGDIVRYIQEHLDPTQVTEDFEAVALLKTDVRDKAKGTFLWVVLIIRELLSGNLAGATLGELRKIVQRVPRDLGKFYQHQLQSTEGEDHNHMLRLLQLVNYAQRSLSPSELRDAMAFGSRAYTSYDEWSESSEYVRSDEQMEKRVREHSRGLVEIVGPSKAYGLHQHSARSNVQFIHQSVKDFLITDGFSFLRDGRQHTHDADGHEFFKTACLNYLKIEDFNAMIVSLRVDDQFRSLNEGREMEAEYPLLNYMARYIFPHAAQAEQHGISQDRFRTYICSKRGYFERWRCLHDALVNRSPRERAQGPEARPIHVLAQYGLLTRAIAERERNIDIVGGTYCSALVAACWGRHQNAVEILLSLGADPKFDGLSESTRLNAIHYIWHVPMAPLFGAIIRHDLLVLRLLLNSQRSLLTLEERFRLSASIREMEIHPDHLEALLALLFPDATFLDSAIDDLGKVAPECTPGVFSLLLDKCDKSIVHEERLWHGVLQSSHRDIMSKIKVLLDRGGRIKITQALVDCLDEELSASLVFSLLLEYCDVEMTNELIDSISFFRNASQILRTFEAKGYRFDSFTTEQLLTAIERGSAETAAFFLERRDGNTSADEMMCSALANQIHGEEVTRLLLGHLNPDRISEEAIIAALENDSCGGSLIKLLHSRWDSLPYCEAALAVAVRNQNSEIVKLVLEGYEDVRVTEKTLTAAFDKDEMDEPVLELLLLHDSDIRVQESTLIQAIHKEYDGPDILDAFCRHGKPLLCTELIVTAAARNQSGPDCLEIVLQQDRGARVSYSMVMEAMRAERGAALISVMLRHDHTIYISEEHLIAAASNCYDPNTIFAFLQTKGKLGNTIPVSEFLNSGPAKRLRLSPRSLPRISTKVINAAFSNPREGLRLNLLELFEEWGVITAADYDNPMSR